MFNSCIVVCLPCTVVGQSDYGRPPHSSVELAIGSGGPARGEIQFFWPMHPDNPHQQCLKGVRVKIGTLGGSLLILRAELHVHSRGEDRLFI